MNFRSRHRPSTEFSLASISDIVFLLLIFFMLTSSFIQQGVEVELPQSASLHASKGKLTITITKDRQFYWNSEPIRKYEIRGRLSKAIRENEDRKHVTLKTDKKVLMEDAAYVMAAVAEYGGSITVATKKE